MLWLAVILIPILVIGACLLELGTRTKRERCYRAGVRIYLFGLGALFSIALLECAVLGLLAYALTAMTLAALATEVLNSLTEP